MKYFEGLCNGCRQKEIRKRYLAMSETEVAQTIEELLASIERIQEAKELDAFWALLAYRDINTARLAQAAYEKDIFWPGELYRDAPLEVVEGLIARLKNPKCKEANDILCCLAKRGGEEVLACFQELEAHPLPWRAKLYVDPSRYAHEGGWTFTPDGKVHRLAPAHCYTLEPSEHEDGAVRVAQLRHDTCEHCGCRLVDILRLDGQDERLSFLGLEGRIHLPLCPSCVTLSEHALIRYTPNGESTSELKDLEDEEERLLPPEELQGMASKGLCLSQEEAPLYFAHGGAPTSTIGGMPDWVQDAEYPTCPDCGRTMRFLGQIVWEQILDQYAEGTLFLTYCRECRVAIAMHQQT
ncbi:MAG: hypothetical protein CSA97_04635 [Bacteroidetes bacterium]|nr:MAG: hypothetical protein CSA97_04635 [Bacteroidota bacterium]